MLELGQVCKRIEKAKGFSKIHIENFRDSRGRRYPQTIDVSVSYSNALTTDLTIVNELKFPEEADGFTEQDLVEAKKEIISSISQSLGLDAPSETHTRRSEAVTEAYIELSDYAKWNIEGEKLFLAGIVIDAKNYPKKRGVKALTRAKNFIRESMTSSKYRHLNISEVKSMEVEGDTLIII